MTVFPGWILKVAEENNSELEVWGGYYLNNFLIFNELQLSPFMAFKYIQDPRTFFMPLPNGIYLISD